MQFQCLPFSLCTVSFMFSKVTKLIAQFLCQLGIHLIIYLHDLMLAAPSKPTTSRLVNSSVAVCCSGFHHKYPKGCNSINPVSGTPMICDKHTEHDHRSSITEDSLNSEGGNTLVVPRCSPGEDLSTFHWHPGGYKASGIYRVFTLSCFTRSPDKDTSPILFLSGDVIDHQGGSGGPTVVGNSASHLLLFPNNKTGSHNCEDGGKVDTSGSTTPHELSRVEGSFPSLTVLSENQEWNNCSYQVRQPYSNCLCKQDGRSCDDTAVFTSTRDLAVVPSSGDYPHAKYLAGKENVTADWESHHHNSSDWQLLPSIFDGINNLLGPFNLYLFASRTNAQLPEYYSWKPDSYAKIVDAFTVSWSQDQPYLFPPFNLIGRALTKIQTDLVRYACLIAPAWPAQVW